MAKNSMDLLELLRKRGGVRRSRRLGRGRLTPEVGWLMEVAVPCDGTSPPFSWQPLLGTLEPDDAMYVFPGLRD